MRRRTLLMAAPVGVSFSLWIRSASAATSNPSEWLTEAMRRMDDAPVIRGEFEQTKTIKGFKKPLVSRGLFLMAKGQGVLWQTQTPFASQLIVTRDRMTTVTEGGMQQMDARQEPGLRAINELLMSVLGGDLRALSARFEITGSLSGARAWVMTLVPKDAALARFISRIEMEGAQHVQQVRLTEGNGDSSLIRFAHQVGSDRLTPAEQARFN